MTDDLKNKDKLLRESDAIEKYINNTYPEYKEVFKNLLITADKQTMVDGKKSLDSYDVKVYKLQ